MELNMENLEKLLNKMISSDFENAKNYRNHKDISSRDFELEACALYRVVIMLQNPAHFSEMCDIFKVE